MRGWTNPGEFAAWNERMARQYDPDDYHLHSGMVVRWIETRRVEVAINLLEARTEDVILEVGCGAGNVLDRVPRGRLVGIDLSSYLLGKAQRRLRLRKASLARSDAERLPFPSNRFDGILCSEVLEHVVHPSLVLQEMLRVAKPSARMVVTVPNEPLINSLKGVAGKLGILRLLVAGNYQTAPRMDEEWHLHSLELNSALKLVPAGAQVDRVVAIPSPLLPLRYVLRLRPRIMFGRAGGSRSSTAVEAVGAASSTGDSA